MRRGDTMPLVQSESRIWFNPEIKSRHFLAPGFIALHTGRTTEAVGHLEQAVRLMPESVTARALLVAAYAEATDWQAARQTLEKADALTVRAPEDRFWVPVWKPSPRPAAREVRGRCWLLFLDDAGLGRRLTSWKDR